MGHPQLLHTRAVATHALMVHLLLWPRPTWTSDPRSTATEHAPLQVAKRLGAALLQPCGVGVRPRKAGSGPESPSPPPPSQAPLVRAPRAPICQTLHALQVFRALVTAPRDTSAPSPISHRLVCSFLRGLPGLARS